MLRFFLSFDLISSKFLHFTHDIPQLNRNSMGRSIIGNIAAIMSFYIRLGLVSFSFSFAALLYNGLLQSKKISFKRTVFTLSNMSFFVYEKLHCVRENLSTRDV